MKNKYLLIIVFVLSLGALFSNNRSRSSNNDTSTFLKEPLGEDNTLTINIKNPESTEIKNIDLEEYVLGVVAAEMPASFNEEALKAQAIASRTYAVYKMQHTNKEYDVLTDISNQAYITKEEMQDKWQDSFSKYYAKIKDAVEKTKDMVMFYNDEVIISYYFAMSNGYTEDAALVFGTREDYLESVDSTWDENIKNFMVTKEFSKEEFCQKLDLTCSNIEIKSVDKSPTGRVNSIVINNKTFKGTEVRTLLNLRSTDFTINLSDVVSITTKGYGHGVGMSQYGAQEMAKLGYNYEEILKYYYQDINLGKVNV